MKDLNNGYYQIVAGERRWRASRIAGITEIPAIIRTYDELATMQIALIENLQREDLNPIEEALSYKALLDDFALTQEKVSEQVGKKPQRNRKYNPAALASKTSAEAAGGGAISGGHARAILSVTNEEGKLQLAEKIIENELNVRQAEQLAKALNAQKQEKEPTQTQTSAFDLQLQGIQKRMSDLLGTKVKILNGAKRVKLKLSTIPQTI